MTTSGERARASGARETALRLVLVAFSVAVVLASLELGLRLFWSGFYLKPQDSFGELHPVRGWRGRPEASGSYAAPEFHTGITHNAWGYRSPPVELARAPGRTRILVLGDSFTYGEGVEGHETFGARLQALRPELEVISTGMRGYGTNQELLLLRDEGLCFRPDVVVVAFFWNDLADNFKEVGAALGQAPGVVARFSLEGTELRYPPEPSPERLPELSAPDEPERRRGWLRYSYAYRFLSDRIKLFTLWLRTLRGIPVDGDTRIGDPSAWALEFALLDEIQRLSRAAGARMLLLVIPDQIQVQPEVRAASVSLEDYAVQDRLRAFARERGIAFLDPLPALRAAHENDGEPLYYLHDRHMRARGHAVVARELAAKLLELGWLDASQEETAAALPEPVPRERFGRPGACLRPRSP